MVINVRILGTQELIILGKDSQGWWILVGSRCLQRHSKDKTKESGLGTPGGSHVSLDRLWQMWPWDMYGSRNDSGVTTFLP